MSNFKIHVYGLEKFLAERFCVSLLFCSECPIASLLKKSSLSFRVTSLSDIPFLLTMLVVANNIAKVKGLGHLCNNITVEILSDSTPERFQNSERNPSSKRMTNADPTTLGAGSE